MGAEDDPCILLAEVADRRQAGPDTGIVGDGASSLSGTLKSARTSTLFPRTSISRMVFFRLGITFCISGITPGAAGSGGTVRAGA
ncbi:hypothetical protein [Methanoculleus bourgensis]|uniref:hypothetical protein n=1 Tax=Methanoculleus bourgensis TaxID=83986 RepID=UPI00307C7F5F